MEPTLELAHDSGAVQYDSHGNVTRKAQTDVIRRADGKGKPLTQAPTTYTFGMTYAGAGPHQLTGPSMTSR